MKTPPRIFSPRQTARHHITWNDVVVLIGMGILVYAGLYVARRAPAFVQAPDISLSPLALPWYALLSVRRSSRSLNNQRITSSLTCTKGGYTSRHGDCPEGMGY